MPDAGGSKSSSTSVASGAKLTVLSHSKKSVVTYASHYHRTAVDLKQ